MEPKILIEKLAASALDVPDYANVLALRHHPLDELENRTRRFLTTLGDAVKLPLHRSKWVTQPHRTLIHMALGATAILHHGSGALSLQTGLKPMESLFPEPGDLASHGKIVEDVMTQTRVRDLVATGTTLKFERLWQIKAAAATREGTKFKTTPPVLCRVVGAYRHFIEGLPVLGPASVALKVAAGGRLDALHVHVRETSGEVIDRPAILRPEQAARRIALELVNLMGKSKLNLDEAARPEWMRFGFLSLSKTKPQRLLAPVYLAAIRIEGQQESQAYMFAVPATEGAYLNLPIFGDDAPPSRKRQPTVVPLAKTKEAA